MKPLSKLLFQAFCWILLLFTSCYFLGSEKGNIRFYTLAYAKREQTEGQKVRFGGIDHKSYVYVDGERRLYAETHYYLIYTSGEEVRKDFYMLLSEDGDSIIDFTSVKGFKPWCPLEDIHREDNGSLDKFIREAHEELGIRAEKPYP